ncbi:MAG: deoxyribose-phosphate aldolase [Oscillospiraceae bacterium]
MDANAILSHVDHTLLKPEATRADIKTLCEQAAAARTASVCINARYVSYAAGLLRGRVAVCTVVGFPLGAMTCAAKVFEAQDAIASGADEIDMVVSIGDVREGRYEEVEAEIRAVKQAIGSHILKVIVETCLLTDEQKVRLCHTVEAAGADYIKTSTGFSTGGATADDVALFARECGGRIKIKAAGGIRSYEDLERFLALGADRLGSSSAIRLIREHNAQ